MTPEQFKLMMEKLEEIRCGIIDVKSIKNELPAPISRDLIEVRNLFFVALEQKTGWGKNELKNLFTGILETFSKE